MVAPRIPLRMSEEKLLVAEFPSPDQLPKQTSRLWNREEKRLWMGSLFCGNMSLYATRTVMPLCAVSLSKHMDWDKTQAGTVLSSFFWGYTMTQVFGGYMSDRIGGDRVITLAAIGWGLLTFWTPVIVYLSQGSPYSLAVLVLSRVLVGCAQGVHFPSVTSVLSRKIPQSERGISFSFIVAGSHSGTLLSGSVGSFLLDHYGWQAPFYASGMFGIGWLLFMRYYTMKKSRRKDQLLSLKDNITSALPRPTHDPVPWSKLFSKMAFWSLLICHLSHTYMFFIILSWMPTYFHDNFPQAKGWIFNVVPWLVAIPSALLSGWLGDKLISLGYSVTCVRKSAQTVCQLGSAFFMLILAYTPSYTNALVCMGLTLLCCGFHNSGVNVNPQDIAPNFAGSVFGLMNTAGAIPGFVGVYVVGHILHVTNSWSIVFVHTAVIAVIGWVVFIIFGTGKQVI